MAIVGLAELAALPGMPGLSSLHRLILRHPDFPIVKRGGHGRRYQIDVDAAEKFIGSLRAPPEPSSHNRAALIRKLGLSLADDTSTKGQ